MAHRHFARGTSTFQCTICERTTRMTTQDDDRFCGECYELLSIQNGLWDDGAEEFRNWNGPKVRDQYLAKITKRGGNTEKVKKEMPDLFAVA
jgi:hypothetical protein